VAEHGLSVSRATAAVKLSRSAYYRKPVKDQAGRLRRDQPVIDAQNELVEANPRWGFWMCFDRLRLDGQRWNHKRVWRVYCDMKLNLPRRKKKRLPQRVRQSMEVIPLPNQVWSMDFMSDVLYRGRLIRTLAQLLELRGKPTAIRCGSGPEFCAQAFVDWRMKHGIEIRYIQPGKPNQNALIERFNKSYRNEVLDAHLFSTLEQVREITEGWMKIYNEYRPHRALGRIPPAMYVGNLKLENSGLELST
jgi:putative transposase